MEAYSLILDALSKRRHANAETLRTTCPSLRDNSQRRARWFF